MKPLKIILGTFVVLSLTSSVSGKANQMAGKDWATKGYRQAAREKMKFTCSEYTARCIGRGNEPPICQSAGAQCKQTGVFIGVKGGRFIASERR
jgi:hypothetical protein